MASLPHRKRLAQARRKIHQSHRLRHNFTACLAEQIKADVTLVKAIAGYDDHEITTGRHSGHYGLMKLYEVVQQVRFDIPG